MKIENMLQRFSCISFLFKPCYRPPRGNSQIFLDNIKVLANKFKGQKKQIFLAFDCNINSLDYSRNTIVRGFFNLAFQNNIFPVINCKN